MVPGRFIDRTTSQSRQDPAPIRLFRARITRYPEVILVLCSSVDVGLSDNGTTSVHFPRKRSVSAIIGDGHARMVQKFDLAENTRYRQAGFECIMPT